MASRQKTAESPQQPLIRAFLAESPHAARDHWRAWLSAANLEDIPWDEMQMLPLLNGNLTEWLAGEPSAARLRGIVRRSWTEAEYRLNLARNALSVVRNGVLTGPASTYLEYRGGPTIRPVASIRLLIAREDLSSSAEALQANGWKLWGSLMDGSALDYCRHVVFARDKVTLYLQWRVLPVNGPESEEVFREGLRSVQAPLLSTECAMLDAMLGRVLNDRDVIPWYVDATLLARRLDIDWDRFHRIANEFAPEAFNRLAQLRQMGVGVPELIYRPKPVAKPPHPAKILYWDAHRRVRRIARKAQLWR